MAEKDSRDENEKQRVGEVENGGEAERDGKGCGRRWRWGGAATMEGFMGGGLVVRRQGAQGTREKARGRAEVGERAAARARRGVMAVAACFGEWRRKGARKRAEGEAEEGCGGDGDVKVGGEEDVVRMAGGAAGTRHVRRLGGVAV